MELRHGHVRSLRPGSTAHLPCLSGGSRWIPGEGRTVRPIRVAAERRCAWWSRHRRRLQAPRRATSVVPTSGALRDLHPVRQLPSVGRRHGLLRGWDLGSLRFRSPRRGSANSGTFGRERLATMLSLHRRVGGRRIAGSRGVPALRSAHSPGGRLASGPRQTAAKATEASMATAPGSGVRLAQQTSDVTQSRNVGSHTE
jgi:hypothetical protein